MFNQKSQNMNKYIIKGNNCSVPLGELYSIHFTRINIDVYLYLLIDICKYISS